MSEQEDTPVQTKLIAVARERLKPESAPSKLSEPDFRSTIQRPPICRRDWNRHATLPPPPRVGDDASARQKAKPNSKPPNVSNSEPEAPPVTMIVGQTSWSEEDSPVCEKEKNGEARRRRTWGSLVMTIPGWLASSILHLLLLLLAALLVLAADDEADRPFLVVETSDVFEEAITDVVFEVAELQMESVEYDTIRAPSADLSTLDFRDIDGFDDALADVEAGVDGADCELGEIRGLFDVGGDGMAQVGGKQLFATFFGVNATGYRFVFVVDSSLSMQDGKFEVACQEVHYSVSRLSPQQRFYVLFFDRNTCRMFDAEDPEPQTVPATSENIQRLRSWMSNVELEFKTNPFEAMRFAISLRPDAIYLLSDGEFTDRGTTASWLKTENLVEDEIGGTKPIVTIHTIGFYSEDNGALKDIADSYGGTYRFVPPPQNIGKAIRPGAAGPHRQRP